LPRTWTITVPRWHPARLNQLLHAHWAKAARMKKSDRDLIAVYCRQAGVPPAAGKRRVSLVLTLGPRQRAADVDAYWKSLLDGLTAAGMLLDDDRFGVELGAVDFVRGKERATAILLADLPAVEQMAGREPREGATDVHRAQD
jgi:Holliday junction resolvase RusA-like endonuclease